MTIVECFMGKSNEPCMRFLSEQDTDQIGATLKERGWFEESRDIFTRNWSPFIHPYRIRLSVLPVFLDKLEDHLDRTDSLTHFFGKKQ